MRGLPHLELETSAILAGAGTSIASGLASGQIFNSVLLARLVPQAIGHGDGRMRPLVEPAPARRRPVRGNIRFEQLVEIIRRFADPELLLMQYLELSWTPTTLHHWLAKAISSGAVALTTNLDLLIELAYRAANGDGVAQIVNREEWCGFDPGIPSLLKLHGTIRRESYAAGLDPETIPGPFAARGNRAIETFKVTLDQIGNLTSSREGTGAQFLLPDYILSTLRSALAGRDLVIAGYSGSDDFDVMPSLGLLRDVVRRVIWIQHLPGGARRIHARGKLLVVQGKTAAVLAELFGESPAAAEYEFDARRALEKFWIAWAREVNLSEAQRFLIAGAVLHAMGMLSHSLSVWESGLDNVRTREPAVEARLYHLLGDAYLTERSWHFAAEAYEEAVSRTERTGELVPHARSVLGHAHMQAITGRAFGMEEAWDEACAQLGQLCGAAAIEPELEECEVRAAITIASLERATGNQDIVRRRTVFEDRLSLLRHYEAWPVLRANKVLRAHYLAEAALAEAESGDSSSFERHRGELTSLCSSLHLPLVLATFVLEHADIAGRTDRRAAGGLYREAERLFRRAGYPVGVAESILGRVVMAMAEGDAAADELEEARVTFEEEHLPWNAEQIARLREAARHLDAETRESIVQGYYEILGAHWREFLGKAGWVTPRQMSGAG